MLCVASCEAWKYVNTTQNPADEGTLETACKNLDSAKFWLEESKFLLQENINVSPVSLPVVRRTLYSESSSINKNGFDKIIRSATSLLHAEKTISLTKGFC